MALERRPQGQINVDFIQMMRKNVVGSEESDLGTAMGGEKGKMAEKIAHLQAEGGIVKTIGAPVREKYPNESGEYQEVMYSMAFPDINGLGTNAQLLLIPHGNGYDQAIITPRKAKIGHLELENQKHLWKFNEIFTPSEDPFILEDPWEIKIGERPVTRIVDISSGLHAEYHNPSLYGTYEEILEKAISESRERKESRENEITMLKTIYKPNDPGDQRAA